MDALPVLLLARPVEPVLGVAGLPVGRHQEGEQLAGVGARARPRDQQPQVHLRVCLLAVVSLSLSPPPCCCCCGVVAVAAVAAAVRGGDSAAHLVAKH